MFWNISLLILGLAALTFGAEGLVRGSASLAIRLGLTPLIIGLTIVAFGTSTPELVVSLGASLNNQADISIGNVVGSNIFNIGIILGLTALLCPVKVSLQVIKKDGPIMIAVSLLALFLITKGTISRLEGIALFTALVAYTAYSIWLAKKEVSAEIKQQFQEGVPSQSISLYRDLLFIGGGLLLLVTGSRLLVISATDIARLIGISEAVIALTIIAAGTSMPELATSIIAALRRQPDIAVGNVVGSNIFNILGILGVASIAKPLSATGITKLDLWVMVVFSVALLPLLYTDLKLQRWEGGLLLLGYGAYLWVLWPLS
ncbi:MAG TPA: calcium/sodium antiporter [Desulfobacterales bacterium]|nr:calcium/sodium antiporter [Desulfobacterales bacterium]